MKCALIIPSWLPEELFPAKTAGSQINYWQPLGTLYVAASLKQAGHRVQFYNGAFMQHRDILQQIREFCPEFVGLYSTTFGWDKAVRTAQDIKAIDPTIFICVGGPFPIAVQKQCLLNVGPSEGLSEGPNEGTRDGQCFDAVVTGEGEITVTEMVNKLAAGNSLRGVQGVIFRQGSKLVENAARPLNEHLDTLPMPARELLGDASRYLPPPASYKRQPVAVMITSRGCNRRCIFCSQTDKNRQSGVRGIRFRSVENVLEEINLCLKQGYKEIKFIDDTLAADYDRLMTLCREITLRKMDFSWFASACVNQVDKPLLRAMKQAGCWAILMGAESGVQKNLNTLRKGITLNQIRKAVKAAKEVGLQVSTPFLFGIPGETFEDGLKTIEFAIELDADLANFHALTAFPGTYLYDNLQKYGRVSSHFADYTYQGAAFEPYSMSRNQIHELRQLALRRFYSRPVFLLRRLQHLRSWGDCKVAMQGVKSLFWLWSKKNLFDRAGEHKASATEV